MENQTSKLRPLHVNLVTCSYTPISKNLRKHPELTPVQKLFLMDILEFQVMGGNLPYLSVRVFAQENGYTEKTVRKHINDLIEAGRLLKFDQKRRDLPCEYLITTEFLAELGYEPISRKSSSETVEEKEVQSKSRNFNPFANSFDDKTSTSEPTMKVSMNKEALMELEEMIRNGESPF